MMTHGRGREYGANRAPSGWRDVGAGGGVLTAFVA